MSNTYEIYLVSDSTGETLERIFLAIKAQFKNINYQTTLAQLNQIKLKTWKNKWKQRMNKQALHYLHNPSLNLKIYKYFKSIPVQDTNILILILTNKMPLNFYNYKFGNRILQSQSNKGNCDKCQVPETTQHFMQYTHKSRTVCTW